MEKHEPEITIRRSFSRNLRKIRLSKSISQEDLAELAGLHRTYVSSVERAERNISIDNIARLAKALGVSVVELMAEESGYDSPS